MSEPDVGIHHAIEFDDYKNWPVVNSGVLKFGMLSMKHMKSAMDGELDSDDTTSRKFGRAVHCRLLEPDLFDFRFQVSTPCCAVLKSGVNKGKQCGKTSRYLDGNSNWFCGQHIPHDFDEPLELVTPDELSRIDRMIASVKKHDAVKLLRAHGGCEVSFIADVFGVRCKGRADKYIPGGSCPPTVVDIKKCQAGSISKAACEKSITNYGYHRQAAIYKLGLDAITGRDHHFVWVFIEDAPPFDVCVVHMDGETFAIGRHEVRLTLEKWKEAIDADEYPGVSNTIEQGGLTEFYRKRFSNWELNEQHVNELQFDGAGGTENEPEFAGEFH